ncbi:hypothetical protein OKW50_004064 [Paraburkholderia youngii]
MDTRDAFDISLSEVDSAFEALELARATSGEDSLAYTEACERYRITILRWKSIYALLAANGARTMMPNVGKGRRLLVLRRGHEPIAESIFVIARVRGFVSTLESCADAVRGQIVSDAQLTVLDGDCHLASKLKAIELINRYCPQCRVAVLSSTLSPFAEWPGVDAVIDRGASPKQMLECFCQLIDSSRLDDSAVLAPPPPRYWPMVGMIHSALGKHGFSQAFRVVRCDQRV